MRIVGGQYGGRRLEVPKNRDIRPTSDKVRGAIFNALESRGAVAGARVLDAFCGTGALGLEALSRGAESCSFWDKDKQSLSLAKSNAQSLGAMGQSVFQLCDACGSYLPKRDYKYDLLFLDPPYRKGFLDIVLKGLIDHSFLNNDTICVLEMERDHIPDLSGAFTVQSEKIYGETKVLIVSYTGA